MAEEHEVDEDAPIFAIALAAELSGMHPQTLRQYDRLGLVVPARTQGGSRRYSLRHVQQLREVSRMSADGMGLPAIARIIEELAIVQPKIVVVMGSDALATLNDVAVPLARTLEPALGVVQSLTPSIDALYVPNIDDALDEEDAKRAFWRAFRVLGDWYADLPPY